MSLRSPAQRAEMDAIVPPIIRPAKVKWPAEAQWRAKVKATPNPKPPADHDHSHRLNETLLRLAYEQATKSPDPSTQNGALLVKYHEAGYSIRSRGFNHVPRMPDAQLLKVLADRELKYPRIVHAEAAAIIDAARMGVSTVGLTLICPWAACLGCAGLILAAGVRRVVIHGRRIDHPYQAWGGSTDPARRWLDDAGVEVVVHRGAIPGAPAIRINRELWQP